MAPAWSPCSCYYLVTEFVVFLAGEEWGRHARLIGAAGAIQQPPTIITICLVLPCGAAAVSLAHQAEEHRSAA